MNPIARQKLIELVERFGSDICDDPRRCEALLRDLCGDQHQREVFVLVAAVRNRTAAELAAGGSGVPKEVLLARLSDRLHQNLGITEDLARWSVMSWALALGKIAGAPGEPSASAWPVSSPPLQEFKPARVRRKKQLGSVPMAEAVIKDNSADMFLDTRPYIVEIPDGVETRVDFALDLYEWLEQGRINRQIRIREEHGAWTTLEALSHYQRRRRFLIASVNSFASLAIIVATVWRYVLNGAGGWGVGSWAFLQLLFVVIASWVGGGFDNKIIMIIASIVTPALGLLASILAPTSFWEYWWIHAIVTPAVWYFAMRVEG